MRQTSKIALILGRTGRWLQLQPRRLRMLSDLLIGRRPGGASAPRFFHVYWWVEIWMLFADFLGIFLLYDNLAGLVKWKGRPLSKEEIDLARTIFGDRLPYRLIRLDEAAYFGPRRHHFAYVSFYTVNSWKPLRPDVLMHELVHIHQYEQLGAAYIPRALRAQRSNPAYKYGGIANLRDLLARGGSLSDLNLEQQADLVMDYVRLSQGLPVQWGMAGLQDLKVYERFLAELRNGGGTGI